MTDWLGLDAHPGRWFVLATLLPLAGFVLLLAAGFLRRVYGLRTAGPLAGWLAVGCMAAATACSLVGAWEYAAEQHRLNPPPPANPNIAVSPPRYGPFTESVEWLRIGSWPGGTPRPATVLSLGYHIDHLTVAMMVMVTVVGTLIFVFALGYMRDELKAEVEDHAAHTTRPGRFGRFYLYLCLFAFAMMTILIADNLLQIFVGWELVGTASFFLIGFYTERRSASTAANKAFLMNRVGDAGFMIALVAAWAAYGTFDIDRIGLPVRWPDLPGVALAGPAVVEWYQWLIGLGIVAGAVGKSAQVPLHTWLPDAMEGPTPVSALIHAATMVAAGVYLIARCGPLLSDEVTLAVGSIGLVTMALSAAIACTQTDIKRVLAFSTGSQLGFMLVALGLGDRTGGLFHLLTHAVFKALLFLAAGSVIHALHHEQDLSKMGGLRRKLPVTAYTMLVGVLAISGVPLLSGWYSKEAILFSAFVGGPNWVVRLVPLLAAGLTAYYMLGLWLLAFAGEPRDRHAYDHAHESPAVMTGPLVVLALLSVGVAWGWPVWNPEASELGRWLSIVPPGPGFRPDDWREREHLAHAVIPYAAFAVMALGFGVAVWRHRRGTLLGGTPTFLRRTLDARFYFDAVYDALFTRPAVWLGRRAAAADKRADGPTRFDPGTLDGLLSAAADAAVSAGAGVRAAQTGRLRRYVLALGLTVVVGLGILLGLTR